MTILRTQLKFTREAHNVFTEKVNKIALSGNDDKKIQRLDEVMAYPYDYRC